jgi:N-acetyltransferase
MYARPITLYGKRVRLEPMRSEHLPALAVAGAYEELWKWTRTSAHTADSMRQYVDEALGDAREGKAIPFVTVDRASGRIIGSTRFASFDHYNRRVEIGWTWITPLFQRTHVNTEAKYLMLSHAFEKWECARVELKTDVLNDKSRNAMLRMGATEEGILRKHILTESGRWRDTIYYSILDTEWPDVRRFLLKSLERNR